MDTPDTMHQDEATETMQVIAVGDLLACEPVDLAAVRHRAHMLSAARGHEFDTADMHQVVTAMFPGWTRCGYRKSDTDGSDLTPGRVYVYRNATCWVGFVVPLRLTHYTLDRTEGWDSLTGARRIGFVLRGLHTGIGKPVVADNAVTFLDAVHARYDETWRGEPVGHLGDMMRIVLTEDIADPDGQVASARMLAGLRGSYIDLADTCTKDR